MPLHLLRLIRSGSFVPSYLNSFSSVTNQRCSLFLYRSLVALTSRRCTFQRLVLLACSTPLTAAEREVKRAVLALTGLSVRAQCPDFIILLSAHSCPVD